LVLKTNSPPSWFIEFHHLFSLGTQADDKKIRGHGISLSKPFRQRKRHRLIAIPIDGERGRADE